MTTTVDRPTTAAPTSRRREVLEALSGLLLAMFVSILSSTIVSNALPTIVGDLHGSQTQYTWVVTATLLTTTVSTPIWGKLADLFDKKRLVQIALVVFVVSSALAGFAQSMIGLIAWRAVQGIGAGGLQALAQIVIATLIPPRERGRYSGYLGAVLAAATVSGPLIGGLLVDGPGWRWCFFVGVPFGVLALGVLQRKLHLPVVRREVRIDYLGAALITGGVSTLLIWVSLAGSAFAWGSTVSLTLAALGAVALVAAVFVELRVPEPVVPMSLFRNRTVVLAVLSSIVVGLVMFGATVFLGQYFQIARSFAPTEAGLLTLPLVGGLILASTVSGQLISRYGRWKPYLVAGAMLMTAGLGLLATVDHATSIPLVEVYLAVLGVGVGLAMQNIVLAAQNTVGATDLGAASSLVAFVRSLGGTIGVTVLGIVLSSRVTTLLGSVAAGHPVGAGDLAQLDAVTATAVRAAYGDAIGLLFGIAAIGSVLALAAVAFMKEVPLRTTIDPVVDTAPEGPTAVEEASAPTGRHARAAVDAPAPTGHADARESGTGQAALAALADGRRAALDLADAGGRLATSVERLRAAGFGERQINALLGRRVADATSSG